MLSQEIIPSPYETHTQIHGRKTDLASPCFLKNNLVKSQAHNTFKTPYPPTQVDTPTSHFDLWHA